MSPSSKSSSGEFERIERLKARFAKAAQGVVVGIGDDAAVLAASAHDLAVSVDTAIEHVHFRREWIGWHDVAYRSQVAAMSDLAAMGADPWAAVVALGLAPDLDDEAFDAIAAGIAEACAEIGYALVGGNLAGAGETSITTTVFGKQEAGTVLRSGAQAGDGIYVTGQIGVAGAGFEALRRGTTGKAVDLAIDRWRRPVPRFAESKAMRVHAHAAIDVSDGLLADLAHLCRASKVGARIEAARVPRGPDFAEAARSLAGDALTFGLNAGEDYEIVFTSADAAAAERIATRIGEVIPGPAVVEVLDASGKPLSLAAGYNHFSG